MLGLPIYHFYDSANPAKDYYIRLLNNQHSGEILIDGDEENDIQRYVTNRKVVVIPQP